MFSQCHLVDHLCLFMGSLQINIMTEGGTHIQTYYSDVHRTSRTLCSLHSFHSTCSAQLLSPPFGCETNYKYIGNVLQHHKTLQYSELLSPFLSLWMLHPLCSALTRQSLHRKDAHKFTTECCCLTVLPGGRLSLLCAPTH